VAFRKYAWVEDVAKVTYHRGRILVDLRYRQPVASVKLSRGLQLIVDETGIVLPWEDVDRERRDSLINITGEGLLAPTDPRPGVVWKARGGTGDIDQADARILAAASLAGFLAHEPRVSEGKAYPALRIVEIIVSDYPQHGLFVMNAEGAEIWWEDAPGVERAGKLSALEKWKMLLLWAQATTARWLEAGDYWAFSKTGLRFACPHQRSTHQPKAAAKPVGGGPAPKRSSVDSG
jgi:hypothetical protein